VTGGSRGWLDRGRRAGFFLLLLALCVALGLLIALPLWLFATGEPRLYTIVALAVLAGGLLFLATRAVVRRRRASRDAPRRPGSLLGGLLSTLATLVGIAGVYVAAALFVRGLWIIGAMAAAIAGLLAWALVSVRTAVRKAHKAPRVPAENKGR
jgi:hypothetical protein